MNNPSIFKKNGELKIKDVLFNHDLTKDIFEKSELAKEVNKKNDMGTGYLHYYFKPQSIDNSLFDITAIFNSKNFIYMLILSYFIEGESSSWEDWSEEQELERKKIHDDWLEKLFGNSKKKFGYNYYEFPCVQISSIYDAKGGFSSIVINYNLK